MTAPLALAAHDMEDLQVLSATVQDAVTRVGDMAYQRRHRRFALMVNRFVWEEAERKKRRGPYQRVRAGLHFDGVLAVKAHRIAMDRPDGVLSLLAISFEAANPEDAEDPSGAITLIFSGGAMVRLEVECIDAHLKDLSGPWRAAGKPVHHLRDA
jgi:hypothetical protein